MANLSITQHKIVLVPFPFDDLSHQKVRPALCLTDPIGSHEHIILAFISSRVDGPRLATDILLAEDMPDFATQVCGSRLFCACIG